MIVNEDDRRVNNFESIGKGLDETRFFAFFNFALDGVYYMLVSWYDAENVDLLDIACPPFYRARNGQVENIVTACLINEGMSKGWLNGRAYNG